MESYGPIMDFRPDSCKFYKEGIYIDATPSVRSGGQFYRIQKLFYVDNNHPQAMINKFDLNDPTTTFNKFWTMEQNYLMN